MQSIPSAWAMAFVWWAFSRILARLRDSTAQEFFESEDVRNTRDALAKSGDYPRDPPLLSAFPFDEDAFRSSFMPNYAAYVELAADPAALIEALSELLTYGTLTGDSKAGLVSALQTIPLDDEDDGDGLAARVGFAVLMILSSPEYLVQR